MSRRNFCFTIHQHPWKLIPHPDIQYCIYQLEKGHDTGKLHYQGYIELKKTMRISAVQNLLGVKCHLEARKGNQEQAVSYCTKDDTRVEEPVIFGTPSIQGKRSDLACVTELKDVPFQDFAVNHPILCVKYPTGLTKLKSAYDDIAGKYSLREVKAFALIGAPGTGKTKYVFDNHPINEIFALYTNSNGTLWFNGYAGEPVLLIDDFKGWIRFTELLKILDRYPYRCEIKGSHTWAKWHTVYITSNHPIDEWYDKHNCMAALSRRITILNYAVMRVDA